MAYRNYLKILVFILLFPATTVAQSFGGSSFRPSGITGSIGFGIAEFQIKEPASNFRMDQGVYAAVSGERGFESFPLFVTLSINYLSSQGQANYDYTTLANEHYDGTDVGFTSTEFQVGLGLKLKIFGNSGWVRPYIEGGGLFGYNEIRYNITDDIRADGSNYKQKDALTSTGYYGEGGLEVSFSESFGVKASYRYVDNLTRAFETLGDQRVRYNASIIKFALIRQF